MPAPPQQSPSATFLACPALFFFLSFSLFFSLFLSLSQSNLTHEGQTGGVSGNPRKFRHSALWNFLGGWSAA
ncbi:hypothetical protein C3368_19600 [Citrobacter freundii complex sp. CFNIH7]|nr:hypothetical protein C3368_19600 [Citrobacter freundii complex sp. CFNIH7]